MAEMRLWEAAAKGDTKTLVDLLEEDPVMLDRVSFSCLNKTPLHISAAKGHIEVVKVLVSAAPDMCLIRDSNGRNPLHLAAINGQLEVLSELIRTCPLASREKADRGQTPLHLCVKHNQLPVMMVILRHVNDYEFLNAKDQDGDTILHLAARDGQYETIQYLLAQSINVHSTNSNGYTALDILELTLETEYNSKLLHIKKSLRSKARESIKVHPSPLIINWWSKFSESLMVVSVLIATMAFQAGMTPPGGFWQDTPPDNSHKAGELIMAQNHPVAFKNFIIANTIAFFSSISTILLLSNGMIVRHAIIMFTTIVIMLVTLTSVAVSYVISIVMVMPEKDRKSLGRIIEISLVLWVTVMAIFLVSNIVRHVNPWLKKHLLRILQMVRTTSQLPILSIRRMFC